MRAGWQIFAKRFWDVVGGVSVRTKIFGIVLGSTILLSLGFMIQVRTTQRALLEEKSQDQGDHCPGLQEFPQEKRMKERSYNLRFSQTSFPFHLFTD